MTREAGDLRRRRAHYDVIVMRNSNVYRLQKAGIMNILKLHHSDITYRICALIGLVNLNCLCLNIRWGVFVRRRMWSIKVLAAFFILLESLYFLLIVFLEWDNHNY